MGPRTALDDVEKRKISPIPGIELRLQPVAIRYTDCAMPVCEFNYLLLSFLPSSSLSAKFLIKYKRFEFNSELYRVFILEAY
jgi:hypothetical protein